MVEVRPLGLGGVVELIPKKLQDARGFFCETWNKATMRDAGLDLDFVQDNHSCSSAPGVLRGLHFQTAPQEQDKLVRVTRGAIFDVAVNIRRGSPDFGRWVGIVISAPLWNQVLIPKGFAHGFLALEAHTEVEYKVTAPYCAPCDRVIRFDDPAIGIDWPMAPSALMLSEKDRDAPLLRDADLGPDAQ